MYLFIYFKRTTNLIYQNGAEKYQMLAQLKYVTEVLLCLAVTERVSGTLNNSCQIKCYETQSA